MFIMNQFIGGGLGTPNRSWNFDTGYLSLSDADLGAISTSLLAVSFWAKLGTSGGAIIAKNGMFDIQTAGGGALRVRTTDAVASNNTIITTGVIDSLAFKHFLVWMDPTNLTPSDRLKVWINGVLDTPSSSVMTTNSMADTTADITIGIDSTLGNRLDDGKIYQLGLFSGRLPSIGEVYASGKRDISLIPNLWSYIQTDTPNIVDDYYNANDWTNTVDGGGPVTLSIEIP